MHKQSKQAILGLGAALAVASAGTALAAVSAEEAKQLGGPVLTFMGAEKAGNKEGTIPAYTGEGVKAPANYDPKDPYRWPDPFANEKPLFSITAQNAAQYADKLDGMIEVFKKYPNFRMDIYPTHRTSTVPKLVADNTIKNATACKGVDNDLRLEGCWGGYAFPIPKNGTQVMWNHLTSYEGHAWVDYAKSFVIANNGTVSEVSGALYFQQSDYFDPTAKEPSKPNTVYWKFRGDTDSPARRSGEKLVLIDALDMLNIGRRAYQYIPGQRRVKLAPDLAYDTPSPNAGGAATMDDAKTFLGALDRYDWKLVGKKEKYIMANTFKLHEHSATCSSKTILTKNFANPDCVRWELHRVWVVKATVKPGFRHIYKTRTFFWDEDNYTGGLAENYDAAGKIYRLVMSVSVPFYEGLGGGTYFGQTFNYDLQTGIWSDQGGLSDAGWGAAIAPPKKDVFFSPESLAGEGIR